LLQLSDNADSDVGGALRGFREGDRVKAVILGIDNRRISLSLKPSYFSKEELEEGVESDPDHPESAGDSDRNPMSQDEESAMEEEPASEGEDTDNEMEIDLDAVEYQPKPTSGPAVSRNIPTSQEPLLTLASGFQWAAEPHHTDDEDADLSSDDEAVTEPPSKKRRKRKEIEQDLTADMHTKTPDSNADFERLLLGSPNSSYLWIQYMSFQLPLSEVDKARDIARRAIRTINFREEQEKLNVWIALLNLENVYGTDETLESIFKEAARANDSKTIHLRLASIFDQSDKVEVCTFFGFRKTLSLTECYRKLRNNTNGHARSLAKAPRCGPFLESSN
jgi:rRNA biogenesis protein RRP5